MALGGLRGFDRSRPPSMVIFLCCKFKLPIKKLEKPNDDARWWLGPSGDALLELGADSCTGPARAKRPVIGSSATIFEMVLCSGESLMALSLPRLRT